MKLKYVVVFERTPNNYGAYAPDVPGCGSTGKTWDEIQANIREALTLHIEAMVENGESVPEPRRSVEEAMAYHSKVLTEDEMDYFSKFGDHVPILSTTFEVAEIDVAVPQGAIG